jgi:2-amino-4-hydroxy-6-hydroxymethyldihydropteridine diphosphokinase
MHDVFLSFGSNIGDKKALCDRALREIEVRGIGTVEAVSPYYRTDPMDYMDQDWFINGVAKIHTSLTPMALLGLLKTIERDLGTREKAVRFGPRTIDLDILLYDDEVVRAEPLVIPHERMHERAFVMVPMCDIDPERIHPVFKKTMKELLQLIDVSAQGIVPA